MRPIATTNRILFAPARIASFLLQVYLLNLDWEAMVMSIKQANLSQQIRLDTDDVKDDIVFWPDCCNEDKDMSTATRDKVDIWSNDICSLNLLPIAAHLSQIVPIVTLPSFIGDYCI
jgi:hypothetical protein